ncbi:MAG: HlyD family efflux transporter periplasmic adaptor subunit [Ruminococcaceae bacterium]|nr:HlyD family efflux transporter periplasmic adaptor subunit [Oscillospiraceae bacterium]
MVTVRKSNKKKIIIPVCLIIIIAIVAGAVLGIAQKNKVVEVSLSEIKTGEIVENINATGVISSGAVQEYSAGTVAQCDNVFVKVGDKVKKGDKLASFSTDELDGQIASLQASYNDASSSYKAAVKNQKLNQSKLNQVNKKIAPLEKKLASFQKSSAASKADGKNAVSGAASKKGDSIIPGVDNPADDIAGDLEEAVKALEELAETISKLSDDITTTNAITREVMTKIAEALENGDYSPDAIAEAAGKAMSDAIREGLIEETRLIVDSGIAVDMIEEAVKSVDWAAIGSSIANSQNVTYASTELQLSALYAQREIFSLGASKATLNAQKQAVNSTKSALDTLKKAQTELVAGWVSSIDGVVTECNVTEGAQTTALQTGIKVENLDQLVVTISLGEYDVHKVTEGMKAVITTAYGEYSGEIASIAPTASGSSSSSVLDNVGSMAGISGLSSLTDKGAGVECVVTVNSPDENIIAGFEANVEIKTGTYENIPTIPIESIVLEKEGSYVYKYDEEEGTVTKTKIEVGAHSDYAYEVKSGLKLGDKIVSTPGQDYEDETFKVRVK